jgi:hypothetical protein
VTIAGCCAHRAAVTRDSAAAAGRRRVQGETEHWEIINRSRFRVLPSLFVFGFGAEFDVRGSAHRRNDPNLEQGTGLETRNRK